MPHSDMSTPSYFLFLADSDTHDRLDGNPYDQAGSKDPDEDSCSSQSADPLKVASGSDRSTAEDTQKTNHTVDRDRTDRVVDLQLVQSDDG